MSASSRSPSRLSEQAESPLMRALMRAGSDIQVSPETRASVLDTLGLEGRTLAQSKPRLVTYRRAAFLLAAMVVSAAAVAVPLVRSSLSVVPAVPRLLPQELVTPVKIETLPATSVGEASAVASRAPRTTSDGPVAEALAVKPIRATDEPGAARHLLGRNALAAELAALDVIRVKLNAGDTRAAQQLLDAYQREFPKPRLALEAEVLRIDALERAGQSEAARSRAAAFIQAHPKGVLTGRVRRYLEK